LFWTKQDRVKTWRQDSVIVGQSPATG